MASRLVSDLDSRIQDGVKLIQRAWADAGHTVILTCTYRSGEEQDALYAQGRTKPGLIVTHAKAGESLHNCGLAIDFLPIVNGKPMWDSASPLWAELAGIACTTDKRASWGGLFGKDKRDLPHLQWEID